MTGQEAKDLSIEVWQYLADHPEIHDKRLLPKNLLEKIRDFWYECPLCELFRSSNCVGCPLKAAGMGCLSYVNPYQKWYAAKYAQRKKRQQAAQKIVDIVKAWKVEETA